MAQLITQQRTFVVTTRQPTRWISSCDFIYVAFMHNSFNFPEKLQRAFDNNKVIFKGRHSVQYSGLLYKQLSLQHVL